MSHDHSRGTWTIDIEGIGKDRKIVGIIWTSDDTSVLICFDLDERIVLSRGIRFDKYKLKRGSVGIIIQLRDPTLSPKHHDFMAVYFEGIEKSVWIGVEDVIGSSFGQKVVSVPPLDDNNLDPDQEMFG